MIPKTQPVDLVRLECPALMLGYLEQMPLYNACNFSWAVLDTEQFQLAGQCRGIFHLQLDSALHEHRRLHVPVRPQRRPEAEQQ